MTTITQAGVFPDTLLQVHIDYEMSDVHISSNGAYNTRIHMPWQSRNTMIRIEIGAMTNHCTCIYVRGPQLTSRATLTPFHSSQVSYRRRY